MMTAHATDGESFNEEKKGSIRLRMMGGIPLFA